MRGIEDVDIRETCADCGADLSDMPESRTYSVDADSILCFECALRRGGSYDELHDRWDPPPKCDDILERDRPT